MNADTFAIGSEHETTDPETGIVRRVVITFELGLDADGFAADANAGRSFEVRVCEHCADFGAMFRVPGAALSWPGKAAALASIRSPRHYDGRI